jgi:hypothetical protein
LDDYQKLASAIGSVLIIAMGIYQTYLQRATVQLMKTTPKNRQADIRPVYWPLAVMVVLGIAIAWLPVFLSASSAQPKTYLLAWGWNQRDPNHQGWIRADGRALFDRHSKFRIAGVCFHYLGLGDPKDTSTLSKSDLYDITQDDVNIVIPYTATFITEWHQAHINGTNYILLLVPMGIKMNQFETLHEAEALGVQMIGQGSGPP